MIEELHSNSTLNSNLTKMKGMEDSMNIRGYVTVIKNAGKSNEEVIEIFKGRGFVVDKDNTEYLRQNSRHKCFKNTVVKFIKQ